MEKQILEILREIKEDVSELKSKVNEHGEILKEHSVILSALKTGQELLKAELSEMKLQNAKDFGEVREQINDVKRDQDINWKKAVENEREIERLKSRVN